MSRICAGLDEIVGAFRTRRLDHIEFPYVYLDATYLHVRNSASQVCSMAVVVATGITADGSREVLGVDVGDSEDEVFWRGFLRSLKARGLGGVRLVISDQHAGLVAALKRSRSRARRINVAASISCATCWPSSPSRHQDMVAAVFRTIFAQPDPATVASTWDEVRDQLAARFPKIGPADGRRQRPRCSPSPPTRGRTGPRSGQPTRSSESTRRSSAAPASWASSPTKPPSIRLVGAVLADMHDEWQAGDRRYLSEGSMAELYPTRDTDHIAELNSGD